MDDSFGGFRTTSAVLDGVLTGEPLGQNRGIWVPDFQRAYEWGIDRHVAWLWGDVLRVYERRGIGGDSYAEHFAGSILIGRLGQGADQRWAPVIDGQQRLITLTLLLAAIREATRDLRTVESDSVIARIDRDLFMPTGDPRLRLRPGDEESYGRIMRGERQTASTSAITTAYRFLRQAVDAGPGQIGATEADEAIAIEGEVDEPADAVIGAARGNVSRRRSGPIQTTIPIDRAEPSFDLEVLAACVTHGLRFVLIADVDPRMYFEVFEALNYKGLPLSQSALIRNGIAMRSDAAEQLEWEPRWLAMEQA